MEEKNIWGDMGYLENIYETPKNKQNAINLYDSLLEFVEKEEFCKLMDETGVKEWWNSMLPFTHEKWKSFSTDKTPEGVISLQEEYVFDYDITVNAIFDVAHNLLEKVTNFNIDDYIAVLNRVTFNPLLIKKEVNQLRPFNELYEMLVNIFTEECVAFQEINFITKVIL